MKYFVEISSKIKNKHIYRELLELGYKNIEDIDIKKLYCFVGVIKEQKLNYIAKHLLVDPVVEEFKVLKNFKKNKKNIIVNIWYKPQVLDVVSLYVLKGLKYIGIEEKLEVHTGKQICITPRLEENVLKDLIEKNFMNPLIQDYEII